MTDIDKQGLLLQAKINKRFQETGQTDEDLLDFIAYQECGELWDYIILESMGGDLYCFITEYRG